MVRVIRCVVASIALLLAASAAHAQAAFEIGVVPNISARTILMQYQPLRQFLERELGRSVQVSTAPDFGAFWQRLRDRQFDLAVAPPHFARLAQIDHGFVPVAMYRPRIQGLLVVQKAQAAAPFDTLHGKCLGVANPQSLVVMRGLAWLAERGLVRDRDFKIEVVRTDDSIGDMVVRGQCPFAMLSNGEFRQVPEALRAQLAVREVFVEFPNFILLARPQTPAAEVDQLRALLLRFAGASDEGKAFLAATQYQAVVAPSEDELRSLDVVLDATRRALGAAR